MSEPTWTVDDKQPTHGPCPVCGRSSMSHIARTLDVLRQMETRDNAPGWTPDEDAG